MNRYQYSVTLITAYKDGTTSKEVTPVTVGAKGDLDADNLALRVIRQELNKLMGYDNVDDVTYSDMRLTHKNGIAVIGYFNWCDTVCPGCVESKHIDVVSFSALYANDTDEYQCSYCADVFPQIDYTPEEQKQDTQRIKQRWEEVYSRT